jgi:hypothetical protein
MEGYEDADEVWGESPGAERGDGESGNGTRTQMRIAPHVVGFMSIALSWMDISRATEAQAPAIKTDNRVHVDDEVAKFERFYRKATASPMSADERWALWQKDYGLAAVPPTPFGRTLARQQLNAVWDRYATLIPELPVLKQQAKLLAAPTLRAVARLFDDDDEALAINLTLFVGQFDNNAFAGPIVGDVPTVFLPVEMTDADVALAHEFAHALHKHIGHFTNGYVAPIGETLLMEGIAMNTARKLRPGHDTAAYTPATVYGSAWLKTCEENADAILKGIAPYLTSTDAEITTKFTYGKGTTGLNDELYCAGWVLVAQILTQGYTYGQLVRVPETELPAFVSRIIKHRLDHPALPE